MLRSKFVKFLMSVLKQHVSASSTLVSFFTVMTHNSSVNFKLIHSLLWTKGSHQSSNFDTSKCSGENLPNSSSHFPKKQVSFSSNLHHSLISWKITPLNIFSSNNIYFAQKGPIKVKIFGTFECSVKTCQIPYVIFEKTNRFLSKFFIPLQSHERYLLCSF